MTCLWNVNEYPDGTATVVLAWRLGKWETREALLTAAGWSDRRIARLMDRVRPAD